MKITEVKIYPTANKETKLKAYASIQLDGQFVITGLKVFNGEKGKFVSMPASKDAEGNWHDIAFPISKEFRDEINAKVLAAYENR